MHDLMTEKDAGIPSEEKDAGIPSEGYNMVTSAIATTHIVGISAMHKKIFAEEDQLYDTDSN